MKSIGNIINKSWKEYQMNLKKAIFGITMAFVLLASTRVSLAATLCVNPTGTGGCYSSINAAIAAAATGDTVSVMPGTYFENVSVNKLLFLLGSNHADTKVLAATGDAIVFVAGSSGSKLSRFAIEADGNGVYSNAAVDITIENCAMKNCGVEGIRFDHAGGTLRAYNNVLYNNSSDGIGTSSAQYLFGNIFLQNHRVGLCSWNPGSPSRSEYNCYFDNVVGPYGCYSSAGVGEIQEDPKFVSAPGGDFHLQPDSPCVNSGRPSDGRLDCDGTRNDMGVYGGPNAFCGPGPVVTQLQLDPVTVVKGSTFNIQAKGATR